MFSRPMVTMVVEHPASTYGDNNERTMIISLMGFMGCGKSSVGRELSALLSCSYTDLDAFIEKETGRNIPDIFAEEGEAAFRRMELDGLDKVISNEVEWDRNMILSLGGGTVMTPECEQIVHEQTLCVYLRACVDTLVSHLEGESEGRPMLASASSLRERISELMSLRSSTYERAAHIILDTDGKSIDDICMELMSLISSHPFRACP